MQFISQAILDVFVIEPKVHGDQRGYFVETFRQDKFEEAIGYTVNFIQDNESKSAKGVLRGLHYQLPPYAQTKLVRVIEGEVLDVAVDIRKNSPTFGKYISVILTGDNKKQLLVPRGFAHGFVVLSKSATFAYTVDNYYSPDNDRGIAFDDQDLAIDWILDKKYFLLSKKDLNQRVFKQCSELFEYGINYYV